MNTLGGSLRTATRNLKVQPRAFQHKCSRLGTWVDDLEGHYADSPDCGCVVPGVKLKVHHTMEYNLPNAA